MTNVTAVNVNRDYRVMRRKLGLNQSQFWTAVRVTQSGGSRYESGRQAPANVDEMVRLRHELGIDTSLITTENADLIRAILEGTLDSLELMNLIANGDVDLTDWTHSISHLLAGKQEQARPIEAVQP